MSRPAPTAVDTTVRLLGEDIIDGRYAAGEPLIEGELVDRYAVSRTTVRAALLVLDARGFITAAAGRRARVADLSDDEAVALYRLRNTLEPMLIARFTERASARQIDDLDRAMGRFSDTARRSEDIRRIHRARDDFYEVLFEGAESRALEHAVRNEYAGLAVYRRSRLTREQELIRIRRSAASVRRVVPTISRREPTAASRFSALRLSEDGEATLRALRAGR